MIQDNLRPVIAPYDKDEYVLEQGFKFVDERLKLHITIPAGFKFDGASIPRAMWTTTGSPFMPTYLGPALIHDVLYGNHMDDNREVSRKEADIIFKKLLRRNGVSKYQTWKMFRAVRMFGGKPWKK